MDDENAVELSFGARTGMFDEDLWINSFNIIEAKYVIDVNDHRWGIGLSNHFNMNVESNATVYPTIPVFESALGYIVSYEFYYSMDDTRSLSGLGLLFAKGLIALGLDGGTVGMTYEHIYYKDTVSNSEFLGSTLSVSLGYIF